MSSPTPVPAKPAEKKPAEKKKPTEKPRDEWYFRRSSFPLRDAAPTELEHFWENQHLFARASNAEWQESGPANCAGRVTCLAVDPNNSETILAGSAGGGLWRTTDRGLTWQPIWPKFVNQNIGAVGYSPFDPDVIICATGEANLSSAGYPGSGVYRSRDGGLTWESFITSPGMAPLDENLRITLPRRIACFAWGPGRSASMPIVAFGSSTKESSLHAGLFIGKDDGSIGYVEAWGPRSYNCYSVVFHPTKPGLIYAAVETRGTLNGIWRSDDFGDTWRQLTAKNGLPPGENCSRISLVISPSHPDVLYALIAARREVGGVIGVFRTRDGGENWSHGNSPEIKVERQLNFNSTIGIHPSNPNYVICGATNLHLTQDGGETWTPITTGRRDGGPNRTFPSNFVHFDHHAIVILEDGWIYSGNDGGFAVSNDNGATWEERSDGMVTTMYYDIDVAASTSRVFGGGAQDAGSLISGVKDDGTLTDESADPRIHCRVLPGDGGWMVFDPTDPRHVIGTSGGSDLYRHKAGAIFANGKQLVAPVKSADDGWQQLDTLKLPKAEVKLRAFTILAVQPPVGNRPVQLWIATNRLRRSEDFGDHWRIASPNFDGSAISALEFASFDPRIIFVGTSDGGIFRSTNNGRTWSPNLSGPEIPRRLITQIEVHPSDPAIVATSIASTGSAAATLNADDRPFGHVFRSSDGGATWDDIDNGRLPNVVFNGLAFETHPPFRIFAAGDAGVWAYQDESWLSITGTLPNVIVSDLIYHPDRILTAATYGRGIWRLPIPEGLRFELDPFIPDDPKIFPPPPAAGLVRDITIDPPEPRLPKNGAIINAPKRRTEFLWDPVPGAKGYILQFIDNSQFFFSATSLEPRYVRFGDSAGDVVWRVWTLLENSRCTRPSRQCSYRYAN